MNFTTHNTDNTIDIGVFTSRQGKITATYKELTSLFGAPTEGDGYKVDAEWYVRFEDGTLATIYNWKNGRNYCGDEGLPVQKIGEWHVGGTSKAAADKVQIALDLHREQAAEAKPKHRLEEALGSAIDMMASLKATKGAAYAQVVEVAMLIRKQADLTEILATAAVAMGDMPESVGQMLLDMNSQIGAHIIAKFVRHMLPETEPSEDVAKEVMQWVDRLLEAEQNGVKSLLKGEAK